MRLQDYDTMTRYQATVVRSERISSPESKEEVREISIEVDSPDFAAGVGQNIGVLAPGQREIGQEHHFRLYSVADLPEMMSHGNQRLSLCVRRCSYVDPFSGEEYPGVASNFLCNLRPGEVLTITGPYGQVFELPPDPRATLILICAGTGIAPFRAFVKHIYQQRTDFKGRVWLFHGGQTGLDLLYRNDKKNDFALYYDHETFEAFDALSNRPGWSDKTDWGTALHGRGTQLCELLSDSKTYVYLAGLEKIRNELDKVLAEVAGSRETWLRWKSDLETDGRWIELLY